MGRRAGSLAAQDLVHLQSFAAQSQTGELCATCRVIPYHPCGISLQVQHLLKCAGATGTSSMAQKERSRNRVDNWHDNGPISSSVDQPKPQTRNPKNGRVVAKYPNTPMLLVWITNAEH